MAGIAAAGLLGCAPALAEADAKRPLSQVSVLDATAEEISGRVSSPAARCVGGRVIQVAELGAADVTLAVGDAEGGFRIAVADLPAGAANLTLTVLRPSPGRQRACTADSARLTTDQGALSGGVSGAAFGGRLTSSEPACVPQRLVEVYEITSDPVFVGSNTTDAAGDWTLDAAGGTYEARAVATILGAADAFTYCRALVSPSWFFEDPV